ncbi:hypothetical protein CPB84DRAFT_836063 [Gymnopilus junonius]|uniref:ArnT-like N-terminal domain-containing protein n=1 Tax=Gymnopilus junonius TaxID=109634 RepID=A0A9P5TNA3_GYMJU|nr:hypothetical protein CPB84DRAFT_836063 [Gymnopilus junonius]
MKPSAVAVDFGTSDPDDFEQIPYPHSSSNITNPTPITANTWTSIDRDEELPLHYMSEEKARRRVKNPPAVLGPVDGAGEYEHKEFLSQNMDHLPPIIYTLLSCWTRFHRIGASNIVVWDEAHFGKFGSHYLKREFYFDVHPRWGRCWSASRGC